VNNIDIHFNAYKCKYESMTQWIQPHIRSTKVSSVRIFVNLDDFFHTLFRPSTNNEFEACGNGANKQFLSNIFNLLAHYRYWAIKMKFDVEVYGFYTSSEVFKNGIYNGKYRKKASNYLYTDKYFYVKETIMDSIDMINIISSYIPKVYVIDTEYLEPSILPAYISNRYGEKDLNILISRDIYDLQYAYRDKWVYISPKGDNSVFIHKGNMWDYINYKEKIYNDDRHIYYPPKMLILARAIVGDTYRDIPRLRSIGWKTLFKYLNKIEEKMNDNSYIVLEMQLRELLKGKLIQDSVLQKNINCISIDHQINIMTEIDKTILDRQIVDIEDYENLKMLNKTKLNKYPLNMKFLCDTIQTTKSNQWG